MQKHLPPPYWSPTGKSGYWVWEQEGQYCKYSKTWEPKWKWLTDEEYETRKKEQEV